MNLFKIRTRRCEIEIILRGSGPTGDVKRKNIIRIWILDELGYLEPGT